MYCDHRVHAIINGRHTCDHQSQHQCQRPSNLKWHTPKSCPDKQKCVANPGEDDQPEHLPHFQIHKTKGPGANHKHHHQFKDEEDGDISFFIFVKMVVMLSNDFLNEWYFHGNKVLLHLMEYFSEENYFVLWHMLALSN